MDLQGTKHELMVDGYIDTGDDKEGLKEVAPGLLGAFDEFSDCTVVYKKLFFRYHKQSKLIVTTVQKINDTYLKTIKIYGNEQTKYELEFETLLEVAPSYKEDGQYVVSFLHRQGKLYYFKRIHDENENGEKESSLVLYYLDLETFEEEPYQQESGDKVELKEDNKKQVIFGKAFGELYVIYY